MTPGANRFRFDGATQMWCYWCRAALAAGDEAAVCQNCGCTHHAACWDAYGCNGSPQCYNRRPANTPYQQNPYGQGGYQQPGGYPPQQQYAQGGYQQAGYYPPPNPYAPQGGAPPARMGETRCPTCGDVTNGYCFRCRTRSGGANAYFPVVQETAAEAKEAMWCACIGIFCFGFILGIVAIVKGVQARNIISQNPNLTGEGLATAAIVIGVLDIIMHACGVIAMIANR